LRNEHFLQKGYTCDQPNKINVIAMFKRHPPYELVMPTGETLRIGSECIRTVDL